MWGFRWVGIWLYLVGIYVEKIYICMCIWVCVDKYMFVCVFLCYWVVCCVVEVLYMIVCGVYIDICVYVVLYICIGEMIGVKGKRFV